MATVAAVVTNKRTPLNRDQIVGFWGAWAGWTLDGMDSFIYALVLAPALTELLPKSGYAATPGNVGLAGSILFALFLAGWGLAFIWGPLADRFGRTKVLAATIFTFSVFTGLASTAQSVWALGLSSPWIRFCPRVVHFSLDSAEGTMSVRVNTLPGL